MGSQEGPRQPVKFGDEDMGYSKLMGNLLWSLCGSLDLESILLESCAPFWR